MVTFTIPFDHGCLLILMANSQIHFDARGIGEKVSILAQQYGREHQA